MNAEVRLDVDFAVNQGEIDIRLHALGQGGIDEQPLTPEVIEKLRHLGPRLVRLFIQEYYNVYPDHNVYDWTKLDKAVEAITETGAKLLMCICIKPKVLYPVINQQITRPTSWEEWEDLIFCMVRHYNVERQYGVKYWEIFNEPDLGERGGCPGKFTPKSYCEYYEHTASAIRRADPTVRVGGPALARVDSPILPALLSFCEDKSFPIDFISWHIYSDDPEKIGATVYFAKELLRRHPELKCETILNEWNMGSGVSSMTPEHTVFRRQAAFVVATIQAFLDAGLDLSCYYHIMHQFIIPKKFEGWFSPQGLHYKCKVWNENSLRNRPQHLMTPDGHTYAAFYAFKMLYYLSGQRIRAISDNKHVGILATKDLKVAILVIWNYEKDGNQDYAVRLRIENLPKGQPRYERYLLDTSKSYSDEESELKISEERRLPLSSTFQVKLFIPANSVTLIKLIERPDIV